MTKCVIGMTFGSLSPEILEDGVRPVIREVAGECGLQCLDLVDLFTDARYSYGGVHPKPISKINIEKSNLI